MISTGNNECVVLYSGGTDSTCVAALLAERYARIHLLSFYQFTSKKTPHPDRNIEELKRVFPSVEFLRRSISVDRLVRYIGYGRYWKYLLKYRFLVLATPGFTSLGWHLRTIVYCLDNRISCVADGLTRELMHFPGHMDGVIAVLKQLYAEFGIEYSNPVRDWAVPPDQQFIDRLVVDQHGFLFPAETPTAQQQRTTGQYLHKLGILPAPNVKGSVLDHGMQYECYPFILYNIMAFWVYLNFQSYESFSRRVKCLIEDKIGDIKPMLVDYKERGRQSSFAGLIE